MYPYPHLSEDALVRQLLELRDFYQGGRRGWPDWMQGSPADLLKEKKFVVCGSRCRPEIRVLAKHANVVAVVDDYPAKAGGEKVFGIEVIDSDAWVEMTRNDSNIVSVELVPTPPGYQHFSKLAMQWGMQMLSSLQYLRLLTACGIDRSGEV